MRAKDKCPSCFQPVAPTDFLCPNCELILDVTQAPTRPVSEVSVVRRMLEMPQRGVPKDRPDTRPPKSATEGLEGPTRKLNLGPELAGVPVVVATLTRRSQQLSELEAWIVSLIDGLHDSVALAQKAGLKELELRVVLRTLHEKQVIDFADEPLSDADLEMPFVTGTLDEDEPPAAPMATAVPVHAVPASPPAAAPAYGANADRRDGRFVAPPSRPIAAPPPPAQTPPPANAAPPAPTPPPAHSPPPPPAASPPPPPAATVPTGRRGPIIRSGRAAVPPAQPASSPELEPDAPIVTGRPVPPVLTPGAPAKAVSRHDQSPPFPVSSPTEASTKARGTASEPRPPPPPIPVERTDPRIAYTGPVNRKVLDALKKVKRADAPSTAAARDEKPQSFADVLARDTLQVALRMEQGGRLDEAIRFLEKSIAQSPDAASLYNRLGIILMRERADYRRAEQLIRKAIELAPENTIYEQNLRQVLSQQAVRAPR